MFNLPVTIVAGYLGSGKTTYINQRLRRANGVRYAVLVNDFGDLNIDVDLIRRTGNDVAGITRTRSISLINGCVCCSLAGDENTALESVLEIANDIDWILLEASGVADSARVKDRVLNWPGFEFKDTVTLVDVTRIQQLVDDKYVGQHIRQQLNTCDKMVLTRRDLVSADKYAEIERWLRLFDATANQSMSSLSPREARHPEFYSQTLLHQQCLVRSEFEHWLRNLDKNIVRLKGFVCFDDNPGCLYLVQFIAGAWEITPSASFETGQKAGARIILISTIPVRISFFETAVADLPL